MTTTSDTADATPDATLCLISADLRCPDRVASPNAPDSRVARVTPICTADRNRLGSWASLAARWPRRPRWVSRRIWPSRSETRAISAPANNPLTSTMSRTMTMSQPTALTC